MKLKIIILLVALSTRLQASSLQAFSLPLYPDEKVFQHPKDTNGVVLINFWASWCTSCIQEVPELEKLKADNPKLTFLAINAGDSKAKIKKFLKKNDFTYKVLMDRDKSFSKGLGVLSLPITMILNKEGVITYRASKPPKTINDTSK
jgi:thiol-disulfide isomerase/thioredoxin